MSRVCLLADDIRSFKNFVPAAAAMEDPEFAAPSEIVRYLSSLVIKDEPPGNRVLYLVALAGVCQRWRQTAVEVASSVPIAFDGADNAGLHGPRATLLKFRKADPCLKRATLLGASKLLKGYSDITLTGESVTDEVLANISRVNGSNLTSIKLLGASSVTDAGIISLVSGAANLKQFVIENAGPGVAGLFVPAILQSCKQLETLHLEGAEGIDWPELQLSGALCSVPQQPAAVAATAQPSHAALVPGLVEHSASSASNSNLSASALLQQQELSADDDPTSISASTNQQGGLNIRRQRVSEASGSLSDEESDDGSSVSAASDSTSISVPAATTAALATQLQQTVLHDSSSSSPAGASSSRQAVRQSQLQQQPLNAGMLQVQTQQQLQPQQQQGYQCHSALRKLHVRFANVDNLLHLIKRCPGLTELHLDGPAYNIQAAAAYCRNIRRMAFLVQSPFELDCALVYFNNMSSLRALELEVKGMMLNTEQLRFIGMLPLRELALDSHAYRQQPSTPRPQYSHLDNEGVKGLVDSICQRMRTEMMPLKLSLCGATALKQEAVSALLRLPMLTAIDTGGCIKLTPMDRMRLVAKVKAGQGMLDSKNGTGPSGGALAALRVPHAHLL